MFKVTFNGELVGFAAGREAAMVMVSKTWENRKCGSLVDAFMTNTDKEISVEKIGVKIAAVLT